MIDNHKDNADMSNKIYVNLKTQGLKFKVFLKKGVRWYLNNNYYDGYMKIFHKIKKLEKRLPYYKPTQVNKYIKI